MRFGEIQELFYVFVKKFFHFADRFAVILQIGRLVKRFGLIVTQRLGVVYRNAEKGSVVPWLRHVEKTVEMSLFIRDVTTLNIRQVCVIYNGFIQIVPHRVVVSADRGILVRIHQRLEGAPGTKTESDDIFDVSARFEQRGTARFAFERFVQPLIGCFKEIFLGVFHGTIQKLVDSPTVGFDEVS